MSNKTNKKLLALSIAIILVLAFVLSGCGLSVKDNTISVELPTGTGQYFENIDQHWPTIVQQVVDDTWSENSTTVISPEYTEANPLPQPSEVPSTTPQVTPSPAPSTTPEPTTQPTVVDTSDYSPMYIHFLDVGQADCILLIQDDATMLIDAGNNADDKMIVQYLKDLGISTIDYFILTHPHEDHIGGADTVINTFTIKEVIMPDKDATSKTYKDVMAAINNNAIAPHYAVPGETFKFGKADVLVVGPYDTNSDEPNNSSVAVKITYGNDTMLFAGDTEREYENLIVESGKFDLRADLFKADHHGSGGANSYVWLREVNPKYVVIQCETGNKYGHPHEEALSRFNDVGAVIYRNDTMGTIIATVTGNGIYFNKEGIEPTRPHVDNPQ